MAPDYDLKYDVSSTNHYWAAVILAESSGPFAHATHHPGLTTSTHLESLEWGLFEGTFKE